MFGMVCQKRIKINLAKNGNRRCNIEAPGIYSGCFDVLTATMKGNCHV